MLKVPFQGEEKSSGARAAVFLSLYHRYAVPVLSYDLATGCQLMPRVRPGTSLAASNLSPDEQLGLVVTLIQNMPHGEPEAFLPLYEYEPNVSVRWRDLCQTASESRLLHGDLHHFNILKGDAWYLIDPKGLWGDPAYEPVAFLRNPVPHLLNEPDIVKFQRERILAFAAGLSLDADRILAWHQEDLLAMPPADLNPTWQRLQEVALTLRL